MSITAWSSHRLRCLVVEAALLRQSLSSLFLSGAILPGWRQRWDSTNAALSS